MKKITLTLALILCLALTVLAFASCGKKTADATTDAAFDAATDAATNAATDAATNASTDATTAAPTDATTAAPTEPAATEPEATEPEATEPEETEPPHVHTPETEWYVETEPTCSTPGRKVLYCEECGEVVDEDEIPIDPDAHMVVTWSAEPTLLNPTVEATGECIFCSQTIPKTFTYEPPIAMFSSSGEKFKPVTVSLGDVRGEDKHFYPTELNPEGNDLYIEFNILWNESFANFDASYMIGHMGGKPFFFLSPAPGAKYADAQFAGAFEWMGHFEVPISDSEVTTPATMCGASPNYSDYPNIAGADQEHPEYGWHRMGIRIHMELIDGHTGEELADYIEIATIFVDGVALCKLSTPAAGLENNATKLFDAAPDEGGNVVFSDMDMNEVVPFEISTAKTKIDTKTYIAIDEISVSCGQDFVMPVEKVTNPTAASLVVEEGVEVTSTIWFQLKAD